MKNILLSIPTIVDANCEVYFGLKFIKIYKDNKSILESDRDEVSPMLTIDLVVSTTMTTNNNKFRKKSGKISPKEKYTKEWAVKYFTFQSIS